MSDAYLRLRQICLVAHDLAPVEKQIIDVLGLEVCYRDPGVGKYGLHNALFAAAGTFLEVVSPTQPNTAGGRYLDRRKGDGGYMYIIDCDDLERRREHFKKLGVRLVQDIKSGDEVPFDDSRFKPGDEVASYLTYPLKGDRADIRVNYTWSNGVHTSVVSRKLITGSQFDVQFDNLAGRYLFGFAAFDNAQVQHATTDDPLTLVFAK